MPRLILCILALCMLRGPLAGERPGTGNVVADDGGPEDRAGGPEVGRRGRRTRRGHRDRGRRRRPRGADGPVRRTSAAAAGGATGGAVRPAPAGRRQDRRRAGRHEGRAARLEERRRRRDGGPHPPPGRREQARRQRPRHPRKDDVVNLANGDIVHGSVADITAAKVTIQTDAGPTELPLDSLASIAFASAAAGGRDKPGFRVRLDDGSTPPRLRRHRRRRHPPTHPPGGAKAGDGRLAPARSSCRASLASSRSTGQ